MTEIERRVAAAQATLDEFKDVPFRLGSRDCVRLAAAHLRRMGHQVRLPPTNSYRTLRMAKTRLNQRGHEDLIEAIDAMGLERIAPAAALPGDVLMIPAEIMDDVNLGGGLAIALGNGKAVGYHEDAVGACVLEPIMFVTAWRA